jgi:hypothetical protein
VTEDTFTTEEAFLAVFEQEVRTWGVKIERWDIWCAQYCDAWAADRACSHGVLYVYHVLFNAAAQMRGIYPINFDLIARVGFDEHLARVMAEHCVAGARRSGILVDDGRTRCSDGGS